LQTQFYIPHPLLQDLIQCIMVIDVNVDASAGQVIIPYPPTPQNSLFFYIGDPIQVQFDDEKGFVLQPRSVIVGPQLTPVKIDINQRHKAVRVGFQPGGLHRMLGLSLHEMIDGNYNAADVFGNKMNAVQMQLQEADGFAAIKEVVEQFLLTQLVDTKPLLAFDHAMLQLVHYSGNLPIEKLASISCLSLRQFERVCKQRIGMPPKLFARITRFSKAYRLYENSSHKSWTSIAHECGYFDQMHFIRDFKEFAGVTPRSIEKELEQLPVRLQAAMKL
jgi:AraC-like DNA-binding protein